MATPMMLEVDRIIQGDCLKVMAGFPAESVDLIVTDPPYGLSFMGKDWDKAVPKVEVWKECLRVLKSGAFAFILCTPRQDCLSYMIVNLESAGFNCGFTSIYWAYASGFPKAANMGKKADKRFGVESIVVSEEKLGGTAATLKGTANRENWYDQGKGGVFTPTYQRKVGASEKGKLLQGSYGGFQPKPAVEIILVAMKPLSERTYVDQALKNQKGVTWLDDARIPFSQKGDEWNKAHYAHRTEGYSPTSYKIDYARNDMTDAKGRFPANLLVSDDVLNDGVVRTSCRSSKAHPEYNPDQFKFGGGLSSPNNQYEDSGSFSRYFDLDAWFEKQLEKLPESVRRTFPFLIVPKASKSEREQGCESLEPKVKHAHSDDDHVMNEICPKHHITLCPCGWRSPPVHNIHPTVKPLKLMSYLVTLGSRPSDLVLDPFVGSGTTCIAAQILNRRWIGIELNPEYIKIAQKRICPYLNKLDNYNGEK